MGVGMMKEAIIIELEWLNRDFDYIWYVLPKEVHDSLMAGKHPERNLIDNLEAGNVGLLAGPFGGPGDWSFDDEADKAQKWCDDNGYEVLDVHEMSADFGDMDG